LNGRLSLIYPSIFEFLNTHIPELITISIMAAATLKSCMAA